MKIKDVHIDGFGVWHGLTLHRLAPDCTVFYGRNEAGKSTLLEFLRGMLFGLNRGTSLPYLEPTNGGTAGGQLTFLSGDSQFGRLRRHARPDSLSDLLSLTVQNEPLAETALPALLCDVDQKTFNNVFAVGLRELQELGTLEDLHASRWLYSLTAGLDRVSLSDVTRELEHSRSRIVSDDATSQVAQLLNQRDQIHRELDDLGELPRHLEQLLTYRDSIDREIESTQVASNQIASDVPALEIAIAIHDLWHRSRTLTAQIDALQSGNTWPANALERMDLLRSQYAKVRRESRTFKNERKKISTELTALKFDERLWRQSAQIAALAEHEGWILSVEQEFEGAEANAKRLDEQYSAHKSQLSSSPASSAVSAAIDSSAWAILRSPAAKISRARRRLKKVRTACDQHRAASLGQKQEIDKALTGRGHRDLSTAVENSGARVQQLRRRIQLDKQLEQNSQTIAELETRVSDMLEQQILPLPTTVTIGAIFVVGVVLILSGLLLPASFTGALGWPMVLLGVLGAGAAIGAKYNMEHAVVTDLESAQKQLAMAETQSKQLQAELKQLDEVLPKGGGPLNLRLQSAEQELAKLEQLLPLDSQRQSADRQAQEQEEKLAVAERIYKKYRHHWRAALASVGLPSDTSPLQAQEIAMAGGRLSAANARLADANSDVERRRRELNALSARIQQVFLAAGLQPESSRTSAQLRQLTNDLAKHEKIQQQRRSLVLQRRRLRRKQLGIADRIEQLRRRRGFLLRKCEVIDVADFNRRAANSFKIKALTAERDAANHEIELTIGNFVAREAVEHHLGGKTRQQLDDLLVDLRKQIAVLHGKRNALDRQRSELVTQIERVSADRRSAMKRFQLGLVEERLAVALRRWQTLTVTHEVLSQVKADYEKNRQPEALRDASKYLARFTSDRYVRVWTTFGEDTLLVQDAQGHSLHVEQLSRGTREQLFLSLRMAIVGMFARRGAHLPMILDDVLVNFDNERAGAGIEVLLEFAKRGHQVIVFTCHEHVARMFKLRGADVRRLPESGRPGQDRPFELEEMLKEPEPEEPVTIPAISVTTTQSEIVTGPSTIEITAQVVNTPAQVDVHFVEPPAVAPVVAVRRARLRVDTPQRKRNSVATIRRRWSAEEFSGELDDRINPQWLLSELSPETRSPVESMTESNSLAESMPHYERVSGLRLLKLFEAEPVPVIVEGRDTAGGGE
jgi:uncharacterized protein YhaN